MAGQEIGALCQGKLSLAFPKSLESFSDEGNAGWDPEVPRREVTVQWHPGYSLPKTVSEDSPGQNTHAGWSQARPDWNLSFRQLIAIVASCPVS